MEENLKRLGLKGVRISGVDGQTLRNPEYVKQIAEEFQVPVSKMDKDYWLSRRNFRTMCRDKNKILGKVGCTLGHLRALKYLSGSSEITYPAIILEDDCVFLWKDRKDMESDEIGMPPDDCDLFYLGGLFWHNGNGNTSTPPEKSEIDTINTNWRRIDTDCFKLPCAFSYGFTNSSQLGHIINLLQCGWNDGPGRLKVSDWKSGNERVITSIVDLMFVNYVQKNGIAYISSPVRAIQSCDFTSDVTDFGEKTPTNPYRHKYFYNKREEVLWNTI
tara:strand:+ start:705 stop:1526 length:822 start_codon:yes stop_codon:yes gene_type:complete